MLERIGAARLLGVNDRKSIWQQIRGLMMIGNNNIHAKLIDISNLIDRTNSCIYRNKQGNALILGQINGVSIKAVAFTDTMRNVSIKVSIKSTQEMEH
ncbi:hypothetical protein D3C85_1700740 [compost metagenome]